MREICSKLIMKTPEQRRWQQWRRSAVFIVKFEYISNIGLFWYFSLTLNK